jgi:hypothetical protein
MKKLIFTSLLMSSLSLSCFSQQIFEKIFDFSNTDAAWDMILTSDNSLLICGNSANGLVLIKTDLEGNTLWQKEKSSFGYEVIESQTGFYYVAGSSSYMAKLLKINSDGETIWSKEWNAQPEFPKRLTHIKQNEEGYFLLSGQMDNIYSQPPDAFTMITDTLGNNFCNLNYSLSIIVQDLILDDGFLTLRVDLDYYGGTFISRFNSFCYPHSTVSYDSLSGYFGDFISDNIGNYYIGLHQLAKSDTSGSILWILDPYQDFSFSNKSILLSGDKIISTGAHDIPNSQWPEFFIMICDTSGSLLNLYTDNTYLSQGGRKILEIDNAFYIAGGAKTNETNSDIFLRKYSKDSLFTYTKENITSNEEIIKTYPNPASTDINIAFQNTEYHMDMMLDCFDIYGRQVHNEKIWKGQQETRIDIREWAKGLYFAVVKIEGNVAGTGRFAKK